MNIVKNVVEALEATGMDVMVIDNWDKNYYLMQISNPNYDEEPIEMIFNKVTGKYATYLADGNGIFVET